MQAPRPKARSRQLLPLLTLLGANAISMIGNVLTMLAIPWFVLQTTGSAAKTGISAFFSVVPTILAAFFGGTIVDRLGYKRASILADLTSGITLALIPLLYATGNLAFLHLLVLVFLGALLDAPGSSARKALIPDLAMLAGMKLERVNASFQAIERGASLLGAPLAGVLIVVMGPTNLLWIDAATFAVSAAMVAVAVPYLPAKGEEAPNSYVNELRAGLQFIWHDRLIWTIVLTVLLTNFLDSPLLSVMMPVYANQVLGSAVDLGLMVAAWGGGSLVGAIIFSAFGHMLPRRATFIGAFIIAGTPFWILSLLPPLPGAAGALAIAGFAAAPLNPIIWTAVHERVPAMMRGRIFGAMTAGAYVAIPLGILLAGYLVEWIGVRATILAQAGCYVLATVRLLFNQALHDLDVPVTTQAEPREQGVTRIQEAE